MESVSAGSGNAENRWGPMPPYAVLRGFLPDSERRALLNWTVSHHAEFKQAKIFYGKGGQEHGLNPDVRIALKRYGIGPFEHLLSKRLNDRLPEITAAAGYTGPELKSLEFEINAYGDGAHFAPHI